MVVFSRPVDCASACDDFERSVRHPAMQRRLAAVTFETEVVPAGERASIAVRDPAGLEVMRWNHMPDWLTLSEILVLIEHAAPHLLEAHRAAAANEPFIVERERALTALAFGDKALGRARLEAMRKSESIENRELAAIWLERLSPMRDAVFAQHAGQGSTARVKLEAWMALGDIRVVQGRHEAAIEAYDRAVAVAEGKFARQNALASRQQAADLLSPVIGLGAPRTVVTGRRSIQPRTVAKNTATVEFRLDGKTLATARRAPFAAKLNFGRIPERQVLELIARDRDGNLTNRSTVVVNDRSEAFDVDFIEPRESHLNGVVDVLVVTRVPRGRAAEQVTIEWNGKQVARFTAPPYRTRVDVGNAEQGLLRAVLRLDDGSEVEDVFMANTPVLFEAGAHLVEVPAYFDVETPAPADVIVREAGIRRPVERIVDPADAPLLVGLVIDSSSSMTPHMLDVQEAAVRFIEENIEPRDRAMIVAFSSNVRILLPPSGDRVAAVRSILALQPRGGTALYDAMINALLQLQSTGSRKAMIVFSDGLDGNSDFSAADVAEVARRAGVPIYVLAFAPEKRTKPVIDLSERTGGKAFEMTSLESLGAHWNEIGADLRRQSLVIYRTGSSGEEWQTLEISVKDRGHVRAPSGVFVSPD